VEIRPAYPQKREKPDLVPFEFQNVEKNNDEKIRKKMWPDQQFPVQNDNCADEEEEKAKQQFCAILILADKGKTDKKCSQEVENAPQRDQSVISRPLKYLVNDGLKKPVVVVPGLRGCDITEKGVMGDGAILPEIPATGKVIPQVGVGHDDRP